MFTGIIEEIGIIKQISRGAHSAVLRIQAKKVLSGTKIGDSICVNGVCLTVTSLFEDSFSSDVMSETLNRSSLSRLRQESRVNLERALAVGERLGGHIVSGHVDCEGQITAIKKDDNAVWLTICADSKTLRHIVEKGSIAIDGASLTVAKVSASDFSVSLIPHTLSVTTFGNKKIGDYVNLETDIIGKYVEKLLFAFQDESQNQSDKKNKDELSEEFLSKCGF